MRNEAATFARLRHDATGTPLVHELVTHHQGVAARMPGLRARWRTPANGNAYYVTLEGQSYRDFALDATMHWTQPVSNGACGVVFRAGDKGGYAVRLSAGGNMQIVKWNAQGGTIIRDWAYAFACQSGTQSNTIAVHAKGTDFTVALNGVSITSFVDADLRFGELGLDAVSWDVPVEARFTYLRLAPPR